MKRNGFPPSGGKPSSEARLMKETTGVLPPFKKRFPGTILIRPLRGRLLPWKGEGFQKIISREISAREWTPHIAMVSASSALSLLVSTWTPSAPPP